MANVIDPKVSVELSSLERQWIVKSISSQRAMLIRSRQKELPGTDIWTLRGREIDALGDVARKFQVL